MDDQPFVFGMKIVYFSVYESGLLYGEGFNS